METIVDFRKNEPKIMNIFGLKCIFYRARKMIQELAKSEGIAEEEMRMEMEKAIETGFSNQDPTVKKIWRASPFRDNPIDRRFAIRATSKDNRAGVYCSKVKGGVFYPRDIHMLDKHLKEIKKEPEKRLLRVL